MDDVRRLFLALGGWLRRVSGGTWRLTRRAARAEGAGETGLSNLIDLHAVNGMADALVAVGLAGTLFFSVPVGEARPRVALYLLITMAPFALLAPVVGPTLDRFPHGRRYALATTMLVRGFLAYVMSGALDQLWLYPAAFGTLVMSKAYGVARSAAVPRLLPPTVTLVAANSRLSLAAIVAASVAAPVGLGLGQLGNAWPLRLAAAAYAVGIVLSLRLPGRADSDPGMPVGSPFSFRGRRRLALGQRVKVALRASAALRALSGFLTLYLAFLLRTADQGVPSTVALGAVVVAAAVGSFSGTSVGARLRLARPHPLQLALLVAALVACALAALINGLVTAVVVALVAGFANSLAKLCLDAVIQHQVVETVRSSAFARSETLLQLGWVVGGAVGLVPFGGWPGFVVAAVVLGAVAVRTALSLRGLEPEATQAAQPA